MIHLSSRTILVFLLCFCPAKFIAQAQFAFSADAEKRFSRALVYYKEGKFTEAEPIFADLIKQKPVHQRTTGALVMEAKTLFQLKEYKRSEALLSNFLKSFPESGYAGDVHYTLALDNFMEERYESSAEELLTSMEITHDQRLSERAARLFENVADEQLQPPFLNQLLQKFSRQEDEITDLIELKLAEKYAALGNSASARKLLDGLGAKSKQNAYTRRARLSRERLEKEGGVKIGVMLPLMEKEPPGATGLLASELLDGINFALNEYSTRPGSHVPVSVDVRDIGRDSTRLRGIVSDLAASQDVTAIIGPLFSNVASLSAPIANSAHVPIISPTATANGIAATGPFVFQANPDYSTRGKATARYAVQVLGARTLAVLTSTEPAESLTAVSFAEEAKRLGAEIITIESYGNGQTDLREQFMGLRRWAGVDEPQVSLLGQSDSMISVIKRAATDPRLIDSLRTAGGSASVLRLFGPDGRRIADTLHLFTTLNDPASEDIETPVSRIQALFVAIASADEIAVIGPQLAYFNIKTQIIGNDEWYDPAQLENHRQYVNGVVFTADSYLDPSDARYAEFDRSFFAATTRHPTKYTVFGEDTMTLLLKQIAEGATTREKLASALSRVHEYPGLHSAITLVNGRVNSNMHIMKYIDGEIKRIAGESIY